MSWIWLLFLWAVALLSFKESVQADGAGQAVCGIGFLLLGVNAFLHPRTFNRPFQSLARPTKPPTPLDALLAVGGPVLIVVGMLIRWLLGR